MKFGLFSCFISFFASSYFFIRLLIREPGCPQPAAMRLRREALRMDGSRRSAGVMEVAALYFYSLLGIDQPEGFYHFVALQIPDEDYVVKLGTTRLINYAHRHNIAVQYWTINDEDLAADLAAKGADAIMSDYPDMVYDILGE